MLLGLRHNDATNSLFWLACDYELSAAPPFHVVTERRHVERHVTVFYLTNRPILIWFFLLNHIYCSRKCIRTSTNIYLKYFEAILALHLHSLNCLSLFRISENDRIAWRQRVMQWATNMLQALLELRQGIFNAICHEMTVIKTGTKTGTKTRRTMGFF